MSYYEENKAVSGEIVERNAIESMERATIDIAIATAQKYPKHSPEMMSKVKAGMLTLATLDEETAASCFYTLPRGGKSIQGESVRLAEIALTCYGNSKVASRIIEIVPSGDEAHVVVQGVAQDLETNTLVSAEVRRRITKKKNKDKPDDDDINLATNACSAIARRNAIFTMIPKAIVRPIMLAAKKVAVGDVKSLATKRGVVVERLNAMGATTDRILAVVGCLKVEDIGLEQLELLIGLGTALKDGDTTLEEAFPLVGASKPGVEGLKAKLSPETPKEEPDKETVNPEPQPEPAETVDPDLTDNPQSQEVPYKYECGKCGAKFDVPKGKNKKLCASCLSDNITQIN